MKKEKDFRLLSVYLFFKGFDGEKVSASRMRRVARFLSLWVLSSPSV